MRVSIWLDDIVTGIQPSKRDFPWEKRFTYVCIFSPRCKPGVKKIACEFL